jgi:predicted lipoprotein with Yx(FWY)xxD motif
VRRLIAVMLTVALAGSALAVLATIAFSATPTKPATVKTRSNKLGKILVDGRSRTLYLFEKDKNGKSACSGTCATNWPPLITTGKPRAAGSARASLLGSTKRADGRLQVTYHHHPLYRFVKDTQKGQTKGEGLDAFGAEWYAVSPAGATVEKESGGGYGG